MSGMTPKHPAAPETETDANGLTDAEREALGVAALGLGHAIHPRIEVAVERIVAERVRVVEGEREAVVEVGAYAQQKEATARAVNDAARMAQVAARRTRELAAMTARAESAEAAHEAEKAAHAETERLRALWFGENSQAQADLANEKAAHERLRAGIWALGESIHGDEGVEHVEGCEGEPTCFACILDTLRSLLGGGEA